MKLLLDRGDLWRLGLEGAGAYETFIRTLNEVIKKYAVKHHKHKHAADASSTISE